MIIPVRWFAISLSFSSFYAWSAEEYVFGPTLDQKDQVADVLVSVATGHAQRVETAPAVISVITADQIKALGAHDLFDVLRTVPGFFLGENTIQVEPIISVRGFKSSYNQNVLVLLDGIPQSHYATGDRMAVLGKIPMDLIERIEIMRGPGSALYGADAYSAVIDIITRTKAPQKNQITLGSGSQRTQQARALGGGQWGGFDWVGAIDYQRTDGHRPLIAADTATLLDGLFQTNASLAPGHENTFLGLLGAQLNVTNEHHAFMLRTSLGRDIGMGVGLANALDPFGRVDLTTVEARYTWKTQGDDWKANVVFDQSVYESALKNAHYLPPGALGLSEGVMTESVTQQKTTRLQGTYHYTGVQSHHVTLGAGIESGKTHVPLEKRNFSLSGNQLIPWDSMQVINDPALLTFGARDFSHDLQFVYGQDEWRISPSWTLTAGLRYDHYSDYGHQFNPRLALVGELRTYLTTKLIYGRGFRGPSLVDTQAQQVPSLKGNRTLRPEIVNSLELAFDYRLRPDLLLRLNLFHQKTDDQIQIVTQADQTNFPQNTARQINRGGELEVKWDLTPQTQGSVGYSYQDSVDKTTDTDTGYHPHHLAYMRWQFRQKPWQWTLQARYVGSRDRRVEDAFRTKADTYTLMDAWVQHTLSPNLEVGLEIRNLLDTQANDAGPGTLENFPSDIPLSGRTYYFTITTHF